jgi:CheY-like chemotaxis protein
MLEVLQEQEIAADVTVVPDGQEAIDYLFGYGAHGEAHIPDLILLDLNLPKKDGREVLAELKADAKLKSIPVVVLTTSEADEDIVKSYDLQASCYVSKPIDFDKFVKIVKSIDEFWFSIVRYPGRS